MPRLEPSSQRDAHRQGNGQHGQPKRSKGWVVRAGRCALRGDAARGMDRPVRSQATRKETGGRPGALNSASAWPRRPALLSCIAAAHGELARTILVTDRLSLYFTEGQIAPSKKAELLARFGLALPRL